MLKILLESLIIECLENRLNLNKEIDYIYSSLNKAHLTDLQKEISNINIKIQELKLLANSILNSEEFKEELQEMGITL